MRNQRLTIQPEEDNDTSHFATNYW